MTSSRDDLNVRRLSEELIAPTASLLARGSARKRAAYRGSNRGITVPYLASTTLVILSAAKNPRVKGRRKRGFFTSFRMTERRVLLPYRRLTDLTPPGA